MNRGKMAKVYFLQSEYRNLSMTYSLIRFFALFFCCTITPSIERIVERERQRRSVSFVLRNFRANIGSVCFIVVSGLESIRVGYIVLCSSQTYINQYIYRKLLRYMNVNIFFLEHFMQ